MDNVRELPPGTVVTSCYHFKTEGCNSHLDLHEFFENIANVKSNIVWLDDTDEQGRQGTCSTCGTRYFSRFNIV